MIKYVLLIIFGAALTACNDGAKQLEVVDKTSPIEKVAEYNGGLWTRVLRMPVSGGYLYITTTHYGASSTFVPEQK